MKSNRICHFISLMAAAAALMIMIMGSAAISMAADADAAAAMEEKGAARAVSGSEAVPETEEAEPEDEDAGDAAAEDAEAEEADETEDCELQENTVCEEGSSGIPAVTSAVTDIAEAAAEDGKAEGEEEIGAESSEADEISETLEDDLNLVTVGRGSLYIDEDDNVICTPASGYEVISITADKDAEDIEKGEEIPEEDIEEMYFEDGTTITAVFMKGYENDLAQSRPASAAAVFGTEDES